MRSLRSEYQGDARSRVHFNDLRLDGALIALFGRSSALSPFYHSRWKCGQTERQTRRSSLTVQGRLNFIHRDHFSRGSANSQVGALRSSKEWETDHDQTVSETHQAKKWFDRTSARADGRLRRHRDGRRLRADFGERVDLRGHHRRRTPAERRTPPPPLAATSPSRPAKTKPRSATTPVLRSPLRARPILASTRDSPAPLMAPE